MTHAMNRLAPAGLMVLALLAGCGGDDPVAPCAAPLSAVQLEQAQRVRASEDCPAPPGASTAEVIAAAAADPANDTATNSAAPFTVMASTPVGVGNSAARAINFTVFSDGKVVQGLTNANVRFAIAKLTPGTNGNPDEWTSYIYRKETASAGVGPGGQKVPPEEAWQATTDPNTAASLVYNADGYYTYTFTTDIAGPNNKVVFEPSKTHRVAIQLSYKNAAGETVLVNPYIDFTFDANGNGVPVDPSATRVMVNVANCNGCHEKLSLHGGGRVDVQYCVMCHNPGTTDANSGNVLTMATMTHKIHSGRLLNTKLDEGLGGEDYTIWGYRDTKHDYGEVGFPQDLRNCNVCHTNSSPDPAKNTPQGDNWQTKVSKSSCLTCHASKPPASVPPPGAPSDWQQQADATWYARHSTFIGGGDPRAMTDAQCVACHNPVTNPTLSPGRVHWNQNEENAAKYKVNIESASYNPGTRNVTVKYFISDPTNGDAAYNLTADCASPTSCSSTTRFGSMRLYLAYQNMVGQFPAVTEFSSYNNGGSGARVDAYKGTNDGSNHYTIDIPVPADTATQIAFGTARVLSIGQIKEKKLQAKSAADPRPEAVPTEYINTLAQNTYKDVVLSGALQPRREVVSNEKCNVCHGALGATSGSNTLPEAFHSGARNTVEACALCHDPNRGNARTTSTVMTNGLAFYESYQFKRMIHGIHGNSKRNYPFTHGNSVVGAFCKPDVLAITDPVERDKAAIASQCNSSLTLASDVENYAAEVLWPGSDSSGVKLNCNACHVNNSYQTDAGTLGAVVLRGPTYGAPADPDPNKWKVISPQAASCTSCHDSSAAIGHVTSFGGASFGNFDQGQVAALPRETCSDCHSPGGFKGVDIVHGLK